jgi:hypothetical protein
MPPMSLPLTAASRLFAASGAVGPLRDAVASAATWEAHPWLPAVLRASEFARPRRRAVR